MTLSLQDPTLLTSKAFVAGDWVDANSAQRVVVRNPANDEILAEVAYCQQAETRRAIEGAHAALASWRRTTAKYRAGLLRRLFDLMMQNQEDLARILTAEQGKPLAEARAEIAYSAGYVEWFGEEAKRAYGDTIPSPFSDRRILTVKQGVGVVAAITPWNFPSAMLGRKIAPALAAGCTMVCKPANATPLSALALAVLAERAGFPPGVLNVLVGNTAEIGAELTANPLVRKLTFTGSTPVGKRLIADCAATVKRTSMELGGNAPFIVFDDADLDAAVQGVLISKFRNAGQTCVCANRILVQDGVYDAFAAKLVEAVAAFQMGDGAADGITIGPLVDANAASGVRELVADALSKGATAVAGGAGPSALGAAFVEPTVLTGVDRGMKVFSEEIFGPVAPLFRFSSEEEAIQMANDTPFGLAAYFYSRDIGRVWRVGEELEYGIVGINEGAVSTEVAPFGGIKESGNGREGSKYGMEDYMEIKYMCMGGLDR